MQDTYFAEMNKLGKASEISYKAPPDNVFTYDVSGEGVFKATSAQPLDECGVDGVWNVTGVAGSKTVSYTRIVTGAGLRRCGPCIRGCIGVLKHIRTRRIVAN